MCKVHKFSKKPLVTMSNEDRQTPILADYRQKVSDFKIAQRSTKDNLRVVATPDTNVARAPSTAIAVPLPPGGRQPNSKPFGMDFYKSEFF